MEIISEPVASILSMVKRFLLNEKCSRWSNYCVHNPISDGVLVFNLLTRELILLTSEEYIGFQDIEYLKEHWFVVPEGAKEKEIADFVKLLLSYRQTRPNEITDYTIFTTTDCNARCHYCFELGCSRIHMSSETAEKAVQYIKAHCGGKKVRICWLGGEPLYNVDAIDSISDGLRREGIEFSSKMISNGYLLDDEIVRRAVSCWNLDMVQITLDGTEKIYNKIKAYIYPDTNPYKVVMANLTRLLDAGIRISVRLNMDLYNADDLLALTKELALQFGGKKGVSVYAHHLFNGDVPNAELHSETEWEKRQYAMDRLNKELENANLRSKRGITKRIKLNHCMADSGKAVTILPDGNIGLCDQHTEDEFVGHLDSKDLDLAKLNSWKERVAEIPECSECFYYMDCVRLKKCSTNSVCYWQFRQDKLKSTQRAMFCEYERWLTKQSIEVFEENVFC